MSWKVTPVVIGSKPRSVQVVVEAQAVGRAVQLDKGPADGKGTGRAPTQLPGQRELRPPLYSKTKTNVSNQKGELVQTSDPKMEQKRQLPPTVPSRLV